MRPASCALAPNIAALQPGEPADALVAVLLGIEPAKEVDNKYGDRSVRSVLTVADASRPSGVEITIWGKNAFKLAYLRPLQIIHIPAVTLRMRSWTNKTETKTTTIECLDSHAPQNIRHLHECECECNRAKGQVVRELNVWNYAKHGELANVVLSARNTEKRAPNLKRKRERTAERYEDENGQVVSSNATGAPIRWIRGQINNVCIRATDGGTDMGKMLRDAVMKVCRTCKEKVPMAESKCTKCMAYTSDEDSCVAYVLDEEAVAVRMEIHDGEETVVAHCAGEDLTRLLLVNNTKELMEKEEARARAARVLSALARDKSGFEIAVQDVGAEVRLRGLRF